VEHIAADFRHVRVRLAKSPLTANYFGTQFGGSMFAMTDPFWMFMLARNLGPGYTVWDQRAEIEFVTPGRTALTTEFILTADAVDEIRAATTDGEKELRWFGNDILDRDGALVARTRKQAVLTSVGQSLLARPVRRAVGSRVTTPAAAATTVTAPKVRAMAVTPMVPRNRPATMTGTPNVM
jgi:acyl-coenzyme A thioesterase PaaI-like protein